jgi:hypothetical protein
MDTREAICPGCGAAVAGGGAGCQTLFDEVLAREFSDYRFGRLHRLTVDAYSLQHPAEYMRSGKSYVAHLTGMCAAMEMEDATAVNGTVQQWLNGTRSVERLDEPPPGERGSLTVLHVHTASTPDQHLTRVQEWARSTWDAWENYHDRARQWIARASEGVGGKSPAGTKL